MYRQLSKVLVAGGVIGAAVSVGCAPNSDGLPSEPGESQGLSLDNALLPDLVVRESELYDHVVEPDVATGRVLLRLSNGTANAGAGKLHLWGVTPGNPDGTQNVMQRVYDASGAYEDRLASKFIHHVGHSHIHFEGWAAYRLRQILPDDGVGPVVAEGAKTSFCIIDLGIYDATLPAYVPGGEFHSCGSTVQGLSVGWIDIYSKYLEGQNIDITGVAPGTYWLESEVDPLDFVLETDETNNATRIKVSIGALPLSPDAFEPNDSAAVVDLRPAGKPSSPNLGPAGPETTLTGLSIHQSTDVDWFRFYANETGAAGDLVRIAFDPAAGELDLFLHDAGGAQIGASVSAGTGLQQISLEGLAEGDYYVRVAPRADATNAAYSLTVNPPENQAPAVVVTAPAAGDIELYHGIETFQIQWAATDPENDATWVSIYVNDQPVLDGTEKLLPTSLHTSGSVGFHMFNSADVLPGTYWVYAEVTDGGVRTGSWSEGTLTFIVDPNCAHPICETGVALVASCDPCVASICLVDPYCCTTGWDSICQNEVATICGLSCEPPNTCTTDHLVISEVRSRGAGGGTDEFVEIHNPTSQPVTLDSTWTLDARSHSGASYVQKWVGANQVIPPGGHFLIVGSGYAQAPSPDAGLGTGITDAGSIRLRKSGELVDALCYHYNASTQAALVSGGHVCEGPSVSNAPHNNGTSGSSNSNVSLERLPGGAGSCQDTGDNAADFISRTPAAPQSLASSAAP